MLSGLNCLKCWGAFEFPNLSSFPLKPHAPPTIHMPNTNCRPLFHDASILRPPSDQVSQHQAHPDVIRPIRQPQIRHPIHPSTSHIINPRSGSDSQARPPWKTFCHAGFSRSEGSNMCRSKTWLRFWEAKCVPCLGSSGSWRGREKVVGCLLHVNEDEI